VLNKACTHVICITLTLTQRLSLTLLVPGKADQFYRVNDFARAYGSLCWNLSKVKPSVTSTLNLILIKTQTYALKLSLSLNLTPTMTLTLTLTLNLTVTVTVTLTLTLTLQVIPRKDLPRIYTMCTPVDDSDKPQSRGSHTLNPDPHPIPGARPKP